MHLLDSMFLFEIPDFQRPFSWEEENFTQLIEDLKEALEANQEDKSEFEDYEPYFLGTIILWTKERKSDGSGKYAVIDGQQRLISLTILMAVLREITDNSQFKQTLQDKIYQQANEALGTSEQVRIELRNKEKDFFKEYVLHEGGTNKIDQIDRKSLTEPKERILQAVETFKKRLAKEDNSVDLQFVNDFIKFLLQKVIIVYVRTDSLASGFRLFNVINTRGLSLNNADLLKSENLSAINDQNKRGNLTQIWENIEEELGTDDLEKLIIFIRGIKRKERARKNIFEEYQEKVFKDEPNFKGEEFVKYLEHVKNIYCEKIKDAKLNTGNTDNDTYYHNLVSVMRDFLPFNEWMAALIKFKDKFSDDDLLFDFVIKLEKKIVVDWVSGYSFTERVTRIYHIIKLIESAVNCDEVMHNQIFTHGIASNNLNFKNSLDNINFYNKGKTKVSKYLLLRLDMEKHYNQNIRFTYSGTITVEHILPRNPSHQYWLQRFNDAERMEWTNCLGNLALLNNRKNPQASNKPFPEKVNNYFEKYSDFKLTQELKDINDWNLTNLKDRHQRLKSEALNVWL